LRTTILSGFALLIGFTAWAADTVPLDVKTGLWEATLNMERIGVAPMPPELLGRLSPEQRAKLEEKMKAAAAPGSKAAVHQHCLTKEALNKPLSFGSEQTCQRTIVTSSRSKQEIHVECAKDTMKSSGAILIEAVDSENVKGSTQMTITDGTRTMNMKSMFTAKWIGPVCDTKEH